MSQEELITSQFENDLQEDYSQNEKDDDCDNDYQGDEFIKQLITEGFDEWNGSSSLNDDSMLPTAEDNFGQNHIDNDNTSVIANSSQPADGDQNYASQRLEINIPMRINVARFEITRRIIRKGPKTIRGIEFRKKYNKLLSGSHPVVRREMVKKYHKEIASKNHQIEKWSRKAERNVGFYFDHYAYQDDLILQELSNMKSNGLNYDNDYLNKFTLKK